MSDIQPDIPGILVLRPAEQASETIGLIRQHGWHAIHFPTVEIVAAGLAQNAETLSSLKQFDWILFISQNAVRYFADQLLENTTELPSIATVGRATTAAAQKAGFTVAAQPERNYSSEGLLNAAEFQQVGSQRILIVRGNGGRELLADTLKQRGAEVSYADIYERRLPDVDTRSLKQNWSHEVSVIMATSNQLLDNLITLAGDELGNLLYRTPLLVISERMLQHAKQLGFEKIWLADGPSNDQMIATIEENISSS